MAAIPCLILGFCAYFTRFRMSQYKYSGASRNTANKWLQFHRTSSPILKKIINYRRRSYVKCDFSRAVNEQMIYLRVFTFIVHVMQFLEAARTIVIQNRRREVKIKPGDAGQEK